MKKKILALVLAFAFVIGMVPAVQAYSVRDAYNDFASQYPEFIDAIVENGVSESQIIDFLRALQRRLYIMNRTTPVTEDNFDEVLIDAVAQVSSADRFSDFQSAVLDAYPDAVSDALRGKIHPDLMPLYETVKSMVFDYNMLDSLDDDDGNDIFTIVSIGELDGISVEKGKTLSLPKQAEGRTETGVVVLLDINWTNQPSTSAEGTFTAEGSIDTIPEGYELGNGVSNIVTVEVTVTPENTSGDDKSGNQGTENQGSGNQGTGNQGTGNNSGSQGNGNQGIVNDNTTTEKHIYNFSDVDAKTELGQAVYALSDIGIINGYMDGTFKPDSPITRAEIAKIMVTAMNVTDANAASNFTDIKDHWAKLYIDSAQKAGLINGYPDGTFKPDNNITRAEVMTIIYRALEAKKAFVGSNVSAVTFSDEALIPDWAITPVITLGTYGVVKGVTVAQPDGSVLNNIDPTSNATRGQCVIMVYNALKMMGVIK